MTLQEIYNEAKTLEYSHLNIAHLISCLNSALDIAEQTCNLLLKKGLRQTKWKEFEYLIDDSTPENCRIEQFNEAQKQLLTDLRKYVTDL